MKLITYLDPVCGESVGVLTAGDCVIPVREAGLTCRTMNELIRTMTEAERTALKALAAEPGEKGIPLDRVQLLAPIPEPLQDVLCLGLNYAAHAKEAKAYSSDFTAEKDHAIYFSKRVSYAVPPMGGIPAHGDVTERLDYEVELAVILGKDAKNVPPEQVRNYIFGYSVCNDMSARDLQTRHKQWYFAKSLDGFFPMGPCIVTADEVAYPPALKISSTVNGLLRQSGNTDQFIHDIDEIVSELSQGMVLKAGTIIATGTPKGVAMGMETPEFLKKGDVVTCSIAGIGDLTNTIV